MVWVCGLIAGLIAVERWRRMGQGGAALPIDTIAEAETSVAEVPHTERPKPKVTEHVVSGAKADYERVRQTISHVMPG